MPLAALLGQGDEEFPDLGPAPLAARNVCLVGVRSFEPAEARLLERLGVRVFFMDEIWQRGIAAVLADALEIAKAGTAGFGVTLDLDVLDPVEAPAVATPVPGGLRARCSPRSRGWRRNPRSWASSSPSTARGATGTGAPHDSSWIC